MQNTKRTKIDLTGNYLARGEIEKAVKVTHKMSDNRIIEKLCYLTKDGGHKLLQENEVDSFTNIKTLQKKLQIRWKNSTNTK